MLCELEVNDIGTYVELITRIDAEQQYRMWFRGQSDYSWGLVPSVQRKDGMGKHYEQYITTNFMIHTMRLNPTAPQRYDRASWLTLMQHYMERNAGYEIKRLLLYDDNKGFALGENLRAPDPYVTWKVTEEQGRRSFDWGHYFTTERAAVKDFLKRAGDYEKENSVFLASEGPQPDSFKYYSTQRPIDIGTFPKGGGNDPIRFQNYDKRLPVEGGAFLAWGELEYGKQLTDDELFCYELRPSRDNPDVWRRMDALAQVVGPWEDMRQLPEGRRLTEWSAEADAYVPTAKATVEKLMECTENIRVRRALLTGDRQPSIRDQLKAAQREALEHQGPEAPKKKAPDRGER